MIGMLHLMGRGPALMLYGYLAAINLVALTAMGWDKRRSKTRDGRIPEVSLLMLGVLGGALGGILGMTLFRHKTRHAGFFIGLPVILVLQICLLLVLAGV